MPAQDPQAAQPEPPKPFLRAEEFRAMLPVSERTFYRMLKAGQLPPHKRFGKVVLFARSDIQSWLGKPAAA